MIGVYAFNGRTKQKGEKSLNEKAMYKGEIEIEEENNDTEGL